MTDSKKRIVIIEDEANIAKAEEMILSPHYDISVAYDGEAGLKLVKEIKPDLIVLDLMLPERGGYDVCFHIRQDDAIKDTKILMVTALAQNIDKDKGTFVGTDDYLVKPFEPDQLLDAVNKLLSK
ncbi:response regulator [Candidatus Woesearchaeota archaeon]|nr:response regulator [Candidatus Woesearchaeota archaeon]MBT4697365.1 response regulator [Candidatus Woesearchaeota archaeon]MBT4717678.1 response regulator [Candidatus Woesearchaeota archaeon]MBT7930778.1 response regulator [Candidatus Woesearchaeota archaeon]